MEFFKRTTEAPKTPHRNSHMHDAVRLAQRTLDDWALQSWDGEPVTAEMARTFTAQSGNKLAEEAANEEKRQAEIDWMRLMKHIREQAEAGNLKCQWAYPMKFHARNSVLRIIERILSLGYSAILSEQDGLWWVIEITW